MMNLLDIVIGTSASEYFTSGKPITLRGSVKSLYCVSSLEIILFWQGFRPYSLWEEIANEKDAHTIHFYRDVGVEGYTLRKPQ